MDFTARRKLFAEKECTSFEDRCNALIERDEFNTLTANRKADRTTIADVLTQVAIKHGASVERRDRPPTRGYCGQEISLSIACKGVGAMIDISDLHGGGWVLIHWYNDLHPSRDFTPAFNVAVGSGGNGRPHHKATSHPRDWYSLAKMLDSGLQLAARGGAFVEEPSAT